MNLVPEPFNSKFFELQSLNLTYIQSLYLVIVKNRNRKKSKNLVLIWKQQQQKYFSQNWKKFFKG